MEKSLNFELVEEVGKVRKITDDPGNEHAPVETAGTDIAIQSEMGQLMKMAIEKNMVDSLEKLIALKRAEEERQCKKDFEFHFNLMQAEYAPVKRGHDVMNKAGNEVLYKFCPLEDILKVYAPIIAKHGFSFRWEEEATEEGKAKRIYCIVSGYGYEKKSYVDIPIQAGTAFTNDIQQRGVSTTYGKRYSFINSFGVIIEDEDNDGLNLSFDDGLEYAGYWEAFITCKTIEDLKVSWDTYMKQNANSKDARAVLCKLKNKRAEEILKEKPGE